MRFFASLVTYKVCSAVRPVNAEEGTVVIWLLYSSLPKVSKRMSDWSVILYVLLAYNCVSAVRPVNAEEGIALNQLLFSCLQMESQMSEPFVCVSSCGCLLTRYSA